MDASFYTDLQRDFVDIRYLHTEGCDDPERLQSVIDHLQKATIHPSANKNDRLLVYCIDTLLQIVSEGNRAKIVDFADTVHNIPEIFLGKRNIRSFHREIAAFQKKYGSHYFKGF